MTQVLLVALERLAVDVKVEIDEVQKLKLQGVEFGNRYAADRGIVVVVVEKIGGVLASQNDAKHGATKAKN